MAMIRCTAKLLREIGVTPSRLATDTSEDGVLGQWHANLIYLDRRKSLLFVNDRTLFNFIVPDVPRSQIRDLAPLFRVWFSCVMAEEGINEPARKRILAEYDDIQFGPSSDRSVLGSANEIAFHYKYAVAEVGGVHSVRVPAIIKELNRLPLNAITSTFPIEAFKKACAVAV